MFGRSAFCLLFLLSGCINPVPSGPQDASQAPTMSAGLDSMARWAGTLPGYCDYRFEGRAFLFPTGFQGLIQCEGDIRLSDHGDTLLMFDASVDRDRVIHMDLTSNEDTEYAGRRSGAAAFPSVTLQGRYVPVHEAAVWDLETGQILEDEALPEAMTDAAFSQKVYGKGQPVWIFRPSLDAQTHSFDFSIPGALRSQGYYCNASLQRPCDETAKFFAVYSVNYDTRTGKLAIFAKDDFALLREIPLESEIHTRAQTARKVSVSLARASRRVAVLSTDGMVRVFDF
ncbi:MAG: hypothetical protein MRY64_09815 [Hyphomonadaceae bacterium]|nr:hypothetical protein [Hyphomonadaceae bacterium]